MGKKDREEKNKKKIDFDITKIYFIQYFHISLNYKVLDHESSYLRSLRRFLFYNGKYKFTP